MLNTWVFKQPRTSQHNQLRIYRREPIFLCWAFLFRNNFGIIKLMVKLGQGRSRNNSSSAVVDGVVTGGRTGQPRKLNKWWLLFASLCVVVAAGTFFYFTHRSTGPKLSPTVTIPSEQQALKTEIQQLEAHKPGGSATLGEKTAYYDKLFFLQGEAADYSGAIKTFGIREAISKDGLAYGNYFYLAQYYCKVGDSDNAHRALATMQSLLPATDDLDTGYSRADTLASIQNLSQDCQL
jgi:hypothetical protein